jgi:predicted membrane protein
MKCRHCGLRYPANCYSPYPDSFASPGQIFVVSIAFAIIAASLLYFGQMLWMWISLGITLFVLFVTMMTVMYCNGMIDKFWARIRNEERIETKQTGEYCPDCQQFNRIYPWSF